MKPDAVVWQVRFMLLPLSYRKDFENELLNDSKQLSNALREVIERDAGCLGRRHCFARRD